MRRTLALVDFVDAAIGWICRATILVTMVGLLAVIGANVVMRYAFQSGGINEVGEIPELLFPWLIGAGIVLGVQRGAHISVDFASDKLGERGKVGMAVFVNLVVISTYAALFVPVLTIAEITSIEHTPLLNLPRSIGFYSIAATIAGVAATAAINSIRVLCLGTEAAPKFDPEESVT